MKAKIWLRPKKIIRVCLITTIIGTLCFVGLNFHSVSVTLTAWQDVFWKAGTISTYDACSLATTDLDFRRTYQGSMVKFGLSVTYIVIMRMVPLLFLVVCGITMLVLLRKKEQKQKALNATRNIYKLSRISTILLINFILLEIPHFMSSVFFVYYFVYLSNSVSDYENATLYDLKAVYVQALTWSTTIRLISKVSSGANSGIVLVVYSLLSRKFREDFMSFFRCNKNWVYKKQYCYRYM